MLSSLARLPRPTTLPTPTLSEASHPIRRVVESPKTRQDRELRVFLDDHLRGLIGRPETLLITVPAPQQTAPQRILELAPEAPAFFWSGSGMDDDSDECAGIGVTHWLSAFGRQRFNQIQRQAETLEQRFECVAFPGCRTIAPRFFGGLAFETGAANDAPWQSFGDGWFMLPRYLYRGGHPASVTLAVSGEDLTVDTAKQWTAETLHLLTALGNPSQHESTERGEPRLSLPPEPQFIAAVAAIHRQISRNRVAKVVAAHRAEIQFNQPLNAIDVLRRLPTLRTTRFFFRRGGTCFLGATPERLVSLRGNRVLSEALAGSAASGTAEAQRLMSSAKEAHEHRLVVQAIQRQLKPYCERLMVPAKPEIRQLRGLQHLATPVHGTLAAPYHVLELAQALHPTPAVAGVPATRARRWIRRHEAEPRGWYSAPVGWFDTRGQGDLAVALRCCVVAGREASVFAGAGIVAGSDPRAEYRETILKMQPLLTALGLEPSLCPDS